MFGFGGRSRSGSRTGLGDGQDRGGHARHGSGSKPPVSMGNAGRGGRKRRSSLSSLDEKATAFRESIRQYVVTRPPAPRAEKSTAKSTIPTTAPNSTAPGPERDFGRNGGGNDKTQQRPLSTSVSASLPRAIPSYDNSFLKPPSRFAPSAYCSRYRGFEMAEPCPSPRTRYPAPGDRDFAARVQRSSARAAAMGQQQPQPPFAGDYPTWRSAVAYPSNPPSPTSPTSPTSPNSPGFSDRQAMYNRPRRLSSSSTATTASTVYSHESFDPRMRSPAWSSQTSFDSILSGGPRPPHGNHAQFHNDPSHPYQFHRPALIKSHRPRASPGELFGALPGEVLELILGELKKLHLQRGSTSCATCWMRDCASVAVSSRRWLSYARDALYEDIQLVGADSAPMKKRYKLAYGARMVLLRRTLRSLPHIAAIVRSLKVPTVPPGAHPERYQDLVASLVMACPNLEHLAGFYPSYRHEFARLFHALSTRQKLKEMDWVLEPSPSQRQQRARPPQNGSQGGGGQGPAGVPNGFLQPQQCRTFVEYHVNWLHLTTLTVHCRPGATLAPDNLLTNTLLCLPLLRDLSLSRLPYNSFNDGTLLQLPPLEKLTLAHLRGVTPAGLSSFATRPNSASVTSLTLLHIGVDSLPALARIFSNLASLASFTIAQSTAPAMEQGELIWLFPYLASLSLRALHWDITSRSTAPSPADVILARSIDANGFPALRSLRTPNDPGGVFQALCKPRERIDLPSDRYRGGGGGQHHHEESTGSNSDGVSSPTSPGLPLSPSSPAPDGSMPLPSAGPGRDYSDLRLARRAAQSRLEAAREAPRYFVDVRDEEGAVVENLQLGAFIGTVESKIAYHLLPDPGATDESGGIVGVAEFLGDGGELVGDGGKGGGREPSSKKHKGGKSAERDVDEDAARQPKEGCTGQWNTHSGTTTDKKDRERWWHTERGRWKGVSLS